MSYTLRQSIEELVSRVEVLRQEFSARLLKHGDLVGSLHPVAPNGARGVCDVVDRPALVLCAERGRPHSWLSNLTTSVRQYRLGVRTWGCTS